ncbi:ABC-2 transporter permease [uncultured Ruminococcus sp.]|uniref:ABC-2 transporter permease n=1 Tax=uncultured Ruminococcus sp. TaxID=165186 RepID=UPI0025D8362C|nr:ABC-2 transporter permease [uncultured Ruminococcus sp.]
MKGLMVKDMLYIRQNSGIFALSLFLTVICAVTTAIMGKVPVGIGVEATVFIGSLPMMFIADDRRTGYEKILAYTPISKDDIVKARYLMMLALSLAGGLILSLVLGIGAFIGSAPMGKVLVAALLFMTTMLLFSALFLPLVYYFKKSNAVMLIAMTVSGSIGMGSVILFKKQFDVSAGAAAVMFVTALVMTAVSCVISVRIFRKTDI